MAMRIVRIIVTATLLASGAVGAPAAEAPDGLDVALDRAWHSATRPGGRDVASFRDELRLIASKYGERGVAAVCARVVGLKDHPEARDVAVSFLGLHNTPEVRELMLTLARDEPGAYDGYAYAHFDQFFDHYELAQRETILDLCAAAFGSGPDEAGNEARPGGFDFRWYAIRSLGRGGRAGDLSLLRKAFPGTLGDQDWKQIADERPTLRAAAAWAMAKLGDADAHREILQGLRRDDPRTKAWGVRGVQYVADPGDVTALIPLLSDTRKSGVGIGNFGNAFEESHVEALDVLAARAMYAIAWPRPQWRLTSPAGTVAGTGAHPETRVEPFGPLRISHKVETLSDEQRAEVTGWAERYVPPAEPNP